MLVTLHTESMDWNLTLIDKFSRISVTLHTESMDWNCLWCRWRILWISYSPHGEYGLKSFIFMIKTTFTRLLSTRRVWIEIMLDRVISGDYELLSTRRVWIEICSCGPYRTWEGLLSTRRVWIEIYNITTLIKNINVTLHTESMDWNPFIFTRWKYVTGYSPHGEYGLKSSYTF